MSERILTVSDAADLGAIISAAQRNAPVGRLTSSGDVITGTARSIGDQRGNFATGGDDVRDCYMRVTTTAGWEAFWRVSELLAEYRETTFVVDYRP
jgi:hypothetical protein